jgi:hypothetical protein
VTEEAVGPLLPSPTEERACRTGGKTQLHLAGVLTGRQVISLSRASLSLKLCSGPLRLTSIWLMGFPPPLLLLLLLVHHLNVPAVPLPTDAMETSELHTDPTVLCLWQEGREGQGGSECYSETKEKRRWGMSPGDQRRVTSQRLTQPMK